MSEAKVFNPRLIAGIAVAGIAAFAAFVLLLAFGSSLGSGRDGGAHARSNSAVGFSGLVRLLDGRGDTAFIRDRSDLRTPDLVVVAVQPETNPRDIERMLNIRGNRPTVLILPKWTTAPHQSRPSWVRRVGIGGSPRLPGGVDVRIGRQRGGARAEGHEGLTGIAATVPASPQILTGKAVEPLLTTPEGGTLVGRIGDLPHFVVADPDLLNNQGIATRDRAWAAVRMIEEFAGTDSEAIHLDLTLDGLASGAAEGRSLLRLALEPPFLVLTLALLVAAFLGGYHGLNRFGPAKREERAIAFGKAALVENSAGLIRQARRETRLGEAYADVVRQEAARITAAPRTLTGPDLDAYLDRFSAPGAPTFSQLAERLRTAGRRDALVEAARALALWKEEIIR